MKYLDISEIESVQIDHTSRCNLACPQCARIYNGQPNPEMPLGELSLDDYKNFFTPTLIKNVKQITQCGNYGDVISSSNILECLEWLRSAGSRANITIMTNGSARTTNWWKDLARILGKEGKVVFSIDGLEDTNHLYRVNSNFNKIIENAQAFISAGGRARWDYLVFAHNEHQVEQAKQMAQDSGFIQFSVKKTNRFINEKNYQGWVKTELVEPVIKRKKAPPGVMSMMTLPEGASHVIQSPTSEKYKAQSSLQFDDIVKQHGSWQGYIDATSIDCKFKKQKAVFLDFEGRVWPCTWTASGIYHYGENTQKDQAKRLLDHYGWDFNSIRSHSIEDIMNHEWMSKTLVESWGLTSDSKPIEKLMCCGRTCGTSYDFSSSSSANREVISLQK